MEDTRKRKRRLIINIILLLCVFWEWAAVAGYTDMRKYSLEADIDYERNPLKLTRIEITNREDLRGQYEVYSTETLYEVRLTAQNPAAYNAGILEHLKFETEDAEDSLYMVYPDAFRQIGRSVDRKIVVPARRTGSIVCFMAAPKDSAAVRVLGAKPALSGEGAQKALSVSLPKQCMETAVWEAGE